MQIVWIIIADDHQNKYWQVNLIYNLFTHQMYSFSQAACNYICIWQSRNDEKEPGFWWIVGFQVVLGSVLQLSDSLGRRKIRRGSRRRVAILFMMSWWVMTLGCSTCSRSHFYSYHALLRRRIQFFQDTLFRPYLKTNCLWCKINAMQNIALQSPE